MIRSRRSRVGIALGVLLLLAGCTPQFGSSTSRVTIYDSPEAMAADSDLVVVGEVIGYSEGADIEGASDIFTVSDLRITQVLSSDEDGNWHAGDVVEVRQFGARGAEEQILVPLVEQGMTYLLFLTLSALDGDLATQFYVTGSSAGLYTPADGSSTGFVQVVPDAELEPNLISVDVSEVQL